MGLIFQGMCLKLKRAGSKTSKKLAEGGTVIVGSELPPECVWFFVLVCFICEAGIPQRLIYGQFFCQGHEDRKRSIQGNYQRG